MRPSVQSLNQAREQASQDALDLDIFAFDGVVELFSARDRKSGRSSGYRRFDGAAEAVRFFIEDLPASSHAGAYLEVGDARFNYRDIERLYGSPRFPLTRRVLA